MAKKHTGQCASGTTSFEFDTDPSFSADRYCKDCQKASGGAMATFLGVPSDDFRLLGAEPKSFRYVAKPGKGLDRNFCPDCGARLVTDDRDGFPGPVFVTTGSLDRPEGIEPILEMFTSRRLGSMKPLDIPLFLGLPR